MSRLPALPVLLVSLAPFFSPPTVAGAQEVEWERPLPSSIGNILEIYYGREARGTVSMTHCSADLGDLCFGGDHEDRFCRVIPACRPESVVEDFLNDLMRAATERPDDPHTVSQAAYAFARMGRHIGALQIAEGCEAARWWCDLVLGMAHQRAGRAEEAEARFRSGLEGADSALVCKLTDVGELLAEFDGRIYEDLTCPQRMQFAETFWWVSDPLLSLPGNDRWAEHVNRRFELLLHSRLVREARNDIGGSRGSRSDLHSDFHEARVVRRGFEDSWSVAVASGILKTWTSEGAARYRFTPAASIGWGFDSLRYEIRATEHSEGYTPADYGPFLDLPAQFARFLDGNAAVVAAAAQLDDAPLDPPTTRFFASSGPGAFPAVQGPVEGEARAFFSATVPSVPLLVGIEAIDDHGAVARVRTGLRPLPDGAVTVSDPVIVAADANGLPRSREEAVAVMRGGTTIRRGDEMIVYWEVYGMATASPIEVAVSVAGETGGRVTRILRALGVRSRTPASVVTWRENAVGRTHPMAVAIDIGALEDGDYELRIEMGDAYGERGTAARRFAVDRRR